MFVAVDRSRRPFDTSSRGAQRLAWSATAWPATTSRFDARVRAARDRIQVCVNPGTSDQTSSSVARGLHASASARTVVAASSTRTLHLRPAVYLSPIWPRPANAGVDYVEIDKFHRQFLAARAPRSGSAEPSGGSRWHARQRPDFPEQGVLRLKIDGGEEGPKSVPTTRRPARAAAGAAVGRHADQNAPGSTRSSTGWAPTRRSRRACPASPGRAVPRSRAAHPRRRRFLDRAWRRFAVMADVLTFYQERIANEAYLRTGDRAALVSSWPAHRLQARPGVAASAWLAFTLDEPRRAPPGA